ncbi:hypothetical protein Bca4012_083252 [Brassica carinata]
MFMVSPTGQSRTITSELKQDNIKSLQVDRDRRVNTDQSHITAYSKARRAEIELKFNEL